MTTRSSNRFRRRLAQSIRAAREGAGLTQKQAAARAGLNPMQISHWETGVSEPTLASLAALADAYGCDLDALVGRRSIKAAPSKRR